MKKRILALAMAAAMALSIAACGNSGNTTQREDPNANAGGHAAVGGESAKKKIDPYSGAEIKIAYVAHDLSTPNNQGWKEGIERECASWGNIKVDSYNGESSAETQVQIMTDIINQK